MNFKWDLRIDEAIKLSSIAHDGQFRKGNKIPYISHPLAVGLILQKAGASNEQIIAGILHDTIEDTYLEFADIEEKFGIKIAQLVSACSEEDPKAPWQERKDKTLINLKNSSEEVKLIVCADKFHNLMCLKEDLPQLGEDKLWKLFGKGRQEQAWYYNQLATIFLENANLENNNSLFFQFKEEVKSFFGK